MRILAGLAPVDRAGRVGALLDEYLSAASGPSMVGAAEALAGDAAIARAKPHLAENIALRMLQVETAEYATAECRNVVIRHALRAGERLAPLRAFAERPVDNPRLATPREAERLIAVLDRSRERVAAGPRHGVQ